MSSKIFQKTNFPKKTYKKVFYQNMEIIFLKYLSRIGIILLYIFANIFIDINSLGNSQTLKNFKFVSKKTKILQFRLFSISDELKNHYNLNKKFFFWIQNLILTF